MSIIDTLITDRTFDDVRSLTNKGLYRAEDLNRVESAMAYLAGRLTNFGYKANISAPSINHAEPTGEFTEDDDGTLIAVMRRWTDGTWIESDIPDFDQMKRYLENLEIVRFAAPVFPTTPQVPPDMDMLTYREANDIEQILVDVDHIMNNIEAAWMYSGEIYAGGVV